MILINALLIHAINNDNNKCHFIIDYILSLFIIVI